MIYQTRFDAGRDFDRFDARKLRDGTSFEASGFVAASVLTAMLIMSFTGCSTVPEAESSDAAMPVDYVLQVKPILESNCTRCHGSSGVPSGRLRLDSRDAALEGGRSGRPAIVPGNGSGSPIVIAASGGDEESWRAMPPRGRALRPEEIRIIRRWIDQGASFDE